MLVKIVKYAPCGLCTTVTPRDALQGASVLFFDGSGDNRRVPIRLCSVCVDTWYNQIDAMRWDPDSMSSQEVIAEP